MDPRKLGGQLVLKKQQRRTEAPIAANIITGRELLKACAKSLRGHTHCDAVRC